MGNKTIAVSEHTSADLRRLRRPHLLRTNIINGRIRLERIWLQKSYSRIEYNSFIQRDPAEPKLRRNRIRSMRAVLLVAAFGNFAAVQQLEALVQHGIIVRISRR